MFVVTPLMKAKQDGAVRFNDAEIVMGRLRGRKPQEGLIPRETPGNVFDADDCPQVFHCCSCRLRFACVASRVQRPVTRHNG